MNFENKLKSHVDYWSKCEDSCEKRIVTSVIYELNHLHIAIIMDDVSFFEDTHINLHLEDLLYKACLLGSKHVVEFLMNKLGYTYVKNGKYILPYITASDNRNWSIQVALIMAENGQNKPNDIYSMSRSFDIIEDLINIFEGGIHPIDKLNLSDLALDDQSVLDLIPYIKENFNIISLNIEANYITKLSTIEELIKSIPTLTELNISGNYIQNSESEFQMFLNKHKWIKSKGYYYGLSSQLNEKYRIKNDEWVISIIYEIEKVKIYLEGINIHGQLFLEIYILNLLDTKKSYSAVESNIKILNSQTGLSIIKSKDEVLSFRDFIKNHMENFTLVQEKTNFLILQNLHLKEI